MFGSFLAGKPRPVGGELHNPVCGLTRVLGCVEVQIVEDRIGQVGVEALLGKSPAFL